MIAPLLAAAPALPGWRPFIDPINLPGATWWLTLIPLALLISVVYKAIRVRSMDRYIPNVLLMTAQIIVAMVLLSIGVHVFVIWIVPALGG